MNKISNYCLVLLVIFFSSCSNTVVVENVPDQSNTAAPISGYFKKRVLIEDYTGTWCGNCMRVAYAIDQVFTQTDKAVSVGIHNGNDPYSFVGIEPLANLIVPNGVLELPVSRLNRTTVWTFPETSNLQQVLDLTSNNTTLGIAMNSTVTNGTIDLNVNVKFLQNYSDLKLVVYLLEDHLIHEQHNYTSYFNGQNPIPNFEHNHVLRTSLTNILGDPISGTTLGATITKNFSIPIPTNISNQDNISFVAFIVGSDNGALNARASKANENQNFEINP